MGDEATPVGALAAVDAVARSPAYLVMEVVTYTDLSQRADLVSTLIERILSALFPTS